MFSLNFCGLPAQPRSFYFCFNFCCIQYNNNMYVYIMMVIIYHTSRIMTVITGISRSGTTGYSLSPDSGAANPKHHRRTHDVVAAMWRRRICWFTVATTSLQRRVLGGYTNYHQVNPPFFYILCSWGCWVFIVIGKSDGSILIRINLF